MTEKEKLIDSKEKEINGREKVIKEKKIKELNNHPYLNKIPYEELKQTRNIFNQNILINWLIQKCLSQKIILIIIYIL